MIQTRSYRFKADPNVAATIAFARFGGSCRWLWNEMLRRSQARYEAEKKFLFYNEMAALLPSLKHEHPWLAETPAASLQRVCRHLDRALKDFLAGKRGFPRPKRKRDLGDAFYLTNQQVRDVVRTTKKTGRVRIPKVGPVKIRGGRWPFAEEELARIGAVEPPTIQGTTVRMDGGDWYVAVQVKVEVAEPEKTDNPVAVGVDLGLKDLATLSDGTVVLNPRRVKRAEKRLKRQQRRVSKAKKGSKNRRKKVMALSRHHAKVRRFRHGFIHQFTARLTAKADVICVEDLAIKGLMRTRMAKSMSDAAWSEIVRQLTYKAEWRGKAVVKIGRFAPSSQACSGCGRRYPEMKNLSRRRMRCECGVDLDRDHNAALNILRWGLEIHETTVGRDTAEPMPDGVDACGESSAGGGNVVRLEPLPPRHGSSKQELTVHAEPRDVVATALTR